MLKFCTLTGLLLCSAIYGQRDSAGALSQSESEFSPPVTIGSLVNAGNRSPENAARTFFWYLKQVWEGNDEIGKVKNARVMKFQSKEDVLPLLKGGGYLRRLGTSLVGDLTDISTLQFSPPETFGGTSDQVVRVRIDYKDGSQQTKAIAFSATLFPDGTTWSARIDIRKSPDGELEVDFAPKFLLRNPRE